MSKDMNDGTTRETFVFRAQLLDTDDLTTDQAFPTDDATRFLEAQWNNGNVRAGLIKRIKIWLNPTNAVTFQFHLLSGHSATDLDQIAAHLFSTPAGLADSVLYDYTENMDIPFLLDSVNLFPYLIDWSAAPGATTGYIEVSGVAYN